MTLETAVLCAVAILEAGFAKRPFFPLVPGRGLARHQLRQGGAKGGGGQEGGQKSKSNTVLVASCCCLRMIIFTYVCELVHRELVMQSCGKKIARPDLAILLPSAAL